MVLSGGRPVVLHIVRTPPQSGLFQLDPVLSHSTVLGRLTVPRMQARIRPRATTVGVNGDFFTLRTGESSGIFLQDGVLSSAPTPNRSALVLGLDGRIAVDVFRLAGTWQAGTFPEHRLQKLNRPIATLSGMSLFTPAWGGPTPRAPGAVEVVLAGFPAATLGTDLTGTVVAVNRGGRTAIPRGGAVLQARGNIRGNVLAAGDRRDDDDRAPADCRLPGRRSRRDRRRPSARQGRAPDQEDRRVLHPRPDHPAAPAHRGRAARRRQGSSSS